ncbi:MAG: hypothetical protein WCO53_14660 [Deltaproteobacteria bacterium]
MARLIEIIKSLMTTKFYGQLTIKFEAGKIIHCQKTESLKLDS